MNATRVVHTLLAGTGLNRLLGLGRRGAAVLCYHDIQLAAIPHGDPGLHLPLARFEQQVEWLARHYEIVSVSTLVERLQAGRTVRKLVALTFDDAYRGALRHGLGILRTRGIPATVYVTGLGPATRELFWWDWPQTRAHVTDERARRTLLQDAQGDVRRIASRLGIRPAAEPGELLPATWAELRAARTELVDFGAHTQSHRNLTTLPPDAVDRELYECADAIEINLGTRPSSLAYPYGLWNADTRRAAERCGFTSAFTLGGRALRHGADPLALPRINVPATISQAAFETWVSWWCDLTR